MELQKQHCLCLIQGEEHSSGSPVQGNIVVIMACMGALYQVCARLVTKLVLCESQNPALISACLRGALGWISATRTWVRFRLLQRKRFS